MNSGSRNNVLPCATLKEEAEIDKRNKIMILNALMKSKAWFGKHKYRPDVFSKKVKNEGCLTFKINGRLENGNT